MIGTAGKRQRVYPPLRQNGEDPRREASASPRFGKSRYSQSVELWHLTHVGQQSNPIGGFRGKCMGQVNPPFSPEKLIDFEESQSCFLLREAFCRIAPLINSLLGLRQEILGLSLTTDERNHALAGQQEDWL